MNQLHGTLPENMGIALPNLQIFLVGVNNLSGTIPESLSNASQLQTLDLISNKFTGQVLSTLGNLKSLQWLELSLNYLGSNSTNEWFFFSMCPFLK